MSSRRRSRGSSQSTSKATKKNKAELRLPSNIGVFRDLVNNRLRPLLHNNHYEALRQTPFFHFINLPAIPNEQVSVDCLLHAFNPEHSSFRIGGKDIVFSFVHVHEITGLPKTGNKVVMDGRAPNTIYTEHVYGKKTQTEKEEEKKAGKRKKRKVDKKDENKDKKKVWATRKRMADLIVELALSNHIACVKLLVVFIIGFVLCPQPSNSCPLWVFRYANNLLALRSYNWAGAVYDLLHKEMTRAKLSITKRAVGERSRAGYMGGFASVLVVWFYELVGELKCEIKEDSLHPIFIERKSRSLRRKGMMRIIENPKCIRNYTSQLTISTIPSASRHQPAMTLHQVRDLLAKNREEYEELIELEKKLISGGNCGNEAENETEGEEESDGDDEEDGGDDGDDEDDGGDDGDDGDDGDGDDEDDGGDDGDDGDDDNTNVGGNVVEDDKGNTGERGVQSNEEMGEDVERSEKSSGRSNSKRKGKQPEMIAEELIEDEDFLPISFSMTSARDIKARTPSIKRVVRDRKRQPARARRSPYTQLRGRGRHEKKEIINVSQLQTPGCDEKNEVIDVSQLQTPQKRRNVNSKTDFIPKNCDYPAKGQLTESERKLLDEFCKKRMNRDEYVWQSVTRLDVYHLLIGSAISDSLVDGMIERFKMKIETEAYSKHIHITGSFFARSLLEDNPGHWARLLKGRQLPRARFEDSEKIIFPILSSSHWHLLELIKAEKKFYHYSSLTYIKYLNDAKMFMNNFLACIKDEWKIKNVDEYSIETRQVAQQDGSLDCGIFMMGYIYSIINDTPPFIQQDDCELLRAKIAIAFISEEAENLLEDAFTQDEDSQYKCPGCSEC